MELILLGNDFKYELEKLCRIFLPFEKINIVSEMVEGENLAVAEIEKTGDSLLCNAWLSLGGKNAAFSEEIPLGSDEKDKELKLAQCLFNCFCKITGYKSSWGILTGVRPAKLFANLCRKQGKDQTKKYFSEELFVESNKISLCEETFGTEEEIINKSEKDWFSLYISIPFCPTRCAYCSFVSHSIGQAKKLVPDYVKLLCEEIKQTAEIAKQCNLKLKTVYMGGGTPTSITPSQMDEILCAVETNFDLSNVLEFTVEAGRPDTVTSEMLGVLKKHKISRISINPQTMNDEVLKTIGRNHTAKMVVDAFNLARQMGFNNINMDLIAGLPGDTAESFKETVDKLLALAPESITVHSLAMKRASDLTAQGVLHTVKSGKTAETMVEYARKALTEKGILPYYMYRQSKTVGNLENVGYAKKGYESLYNVYIMDETHTILGVGASAVTKLKSPNGPEISRIFNFKYPYEYISRYDELAARKKGIAEFYEQHGG